MADVIVPTVHLNGTSGESLIEQLNTVDLALDAAMTAMADATPHDRDYYVQADPDAGAKARHAHIERMKRIEAVQHEIMELRLGVYTQLHPRAPMRETTNG